LKLTTNFEKGQLLGFNVYPGGDLKLIANFGKIKIGDYNSTFKLKFNTNKKFDCAEAKLHSEYESDNIDVHTSLKGDVCGKEAFLSNKTIYKNKEWRFGTSFSLDLLKFSLIKYHGFASYRHKDNEFTFEHNS